MAPSRAAVASLGAWACLGFLALGCDDHCNRPPIFVPALNIEIIDAVSGEPICDAQVVLERSGSVVRALPGACRVSSDSQSPGSYRISVDHPDYQAAEQVVLVAEDDCGYAEPRDITIELTAR